MNKGQIVQSDTAENIYTQPATEFVARFMGHYNLVDSEKANTMLGLNLQVHLLSALSLYMSKAGRQYGSHISHPVDAVIWTISCSAILFVIV